MPSPNGDSSIRGFPRTYQSIQERLAAGKAARQKTPRSSHAVWTPSPERPDVISLLENSNRGRLSELIPIRYGHMSQSPFAFLRGSAVVMASDLANAPTSGIHVQACGDCHLSNFGTFASPERSLLFDINDFDETLPAPWEWDVKRLATSFLVASRNIGVNERSGVAAAQTVARSYRERMAEFAGMRNLDVWYYRIDVDTLIAMSKSAEARKKRKELADKARQSTITSAMPKLTDLLDGQRVIVDHPPLIYHIEDNDELEDEIRYCMAAYKESLSDDRRALLDRYQLADIAMKVVGVGSVGTRCMIALLEANASDPLFLQFKEARESVLAPYFGPSKYANNGRRIVEGQRLMQSASDIFLGWARAEGRGIDFYFRQLRDMKFSIELKPGFSASDLIDYAEVCGWTLARAHAKSGQAPEIAGYLGRADTFDQAIAVFATAYADQTERDHKTLVKAIREGRLTAVIEKKKEST